MLSRFAGALVALPLTLAFALTLTSATSSGAAGAAAVESVTIKGRGYGHGHGLSQWGAQNAASQGLSYRQILRFYYPGLAWGKAGGKVSVLVSADRTRDVMVRARPGLTVEQVRGAKSIQTTKARPRAQRWRIVPLAGGRSRVDYFQSRWRRLATFRGDAEFTAGGRPITLFVTNKSRVAYRGVLRSAGRDTVNILPLDHYLRGVVPQEVPALWHPHAVRAQAVAARTYAAFERRQPLARHYQICDTTQCQVYGGYSAEQAGSNAAIQATSRQVLTKGGRPAFTQFAASNGGWTSAGGFPYLPAKRDPYDTWPGNPYNSWTATVAAKTVETAFPAIGDLTGVQVVDTDGNGRWGGRATAVRITGTTTDTTITGDTFRSIFGLRSTYFTVV